MLLELLQQTGLTKYEAEAYAALLASGQLTGYELGKRSGVPLSRCYEVLERLVARGLALVQPGDPVRYAAEQPDDFLRRLRSAQEATLTALARELDGLARPAAAGGVWVVRGAEHVLDRAGLMIASAERSVQLSAPRAACERLAEPLEQARGRGCTVRSTALHGTEAGAAILLLVDGREPLAGALDPAEHCQAITGANPGLVAALTGYFAPSRDAELPLPATAVRPTAPDPLAWQEWEFAKQRRLLRAV